MEADNTTRYWDFNDPRASLQKKYDEALALATAKNHWYVVNSRLKSVWSKTLRAAAIVTAGVGGLFPLLDVARLFGREYNLSQWGYLFFALSGAMVLFDKFFGISSGWVRYIQTRMELEQSIRDFKMRWLLEMIKLENQPLLTTQVLELMDMIRDFMGRVLEIERKETEIWANEFQTRIAEIQQLVKTQSLASKNGAISVHVLNAAAFERVIVKLNGLTVKILEGSGGRIPNVAPGNHEITVIGYINDREVMEGTVVQVTPEALALVELSLPL